MIEKEYELNCVNAKIRQNSTTAFSTVLIHYQRLNMIKRIKLSL